MSQTIVDLMQKDLITQSDSAKAQIYQRFFKTGKGEYGEGDRFIGLTVPQSRKIAFKYKHITIKDVGDLLKSEFHEIRLVALFVLIEIFDKSNSLKQKRIVEFYLKHTKYINNWDLVDMSAYKILGAYLFHHTNSLKCATLQGMAKSKSLWERRIAIVSTFYFIKNNRFELTIEISKLLLSDKHDLIHKAVGWMLREVGKRNKKLLVEFLNKYKLKMSRTTLRYSIEKFPKNQRQKLLCKIT